MLISPQTLHLLLVNFEKNPSGCGFFSRKSSIRSCFESLRGNLEDHSTDGYVRMYSELSAAQMTQLINGLNTYIRTVKNISDLSNIDNAMVHQFMCESLLWYELNEPTTKDSFREVVNAYFYALNKKIKLITDPTEITPLNIWLQYFIENPQVYIDHIFVGGNGNSYKLALLDLRECACVDISHDRTLSDLRLETERRIIEECKKVQLSQPKSPLKMLSLGTGEGLQDFLIVLKLFALGIQNIDLTFIERDYDCLLKPEESSVKYWDKEWKTGDKLPPKYFRDEEPKLYSIIRALSLLSKKHIDSKLAISQYHSVQQLKEEKQHIESYDIIHAIDLDDYESKSTSHTDFHALADCLKPTGTAIASHHYEIDVFKAEKKDDVRIFKLEDTVRHAQTVPEIKANKMNYKIKHGPESFTKI